MEPIKHKKLEKKKSNSLIAQLRMKQLPVDILDRLDFDRLHEQEEDFMSMDTRRKVAIDTVMLKPRVKKIVESQPSEDDVKSMFKVSP